MNSPFEHCIRCTICVENCPVFKVNPDFPGPKQSGPDGQRFRLDNEKSIDDWIKNCLQCKRCEVACPYGVNPAEIILEEQLKYGKEHIKPLTQIMFANNYYLGMMGSLAAPIANAITPLNIAKEGMKLIGIDSEVAFPKFHFNSLSKNWPVKGNGSRKVVFFHGCYLNNNAPDVGRGIIDLLVSMGLTVKTPRQWCCGLPALGNGDYATARRFADKNARMLTSYIDRGYDVVYSCTSCGNTLLHDYPGILDVEGGKKIAENTYNIHEYILNLIDDGYVNPTWGAVNRKIAYHIPCHLRAAGIGYPAAQLFRNIPGLEFTILEDNCCGLSGSYGFKKKNKETATKLGTIAATAIKDTGAEAFVSDCGACRMQLGHFAAMPAIDPSEIIIASLKNAAS